MNDESHDPMDLPLFADEHSNGQGLPGRVRSTFRLDGSPRPAPGNGIARTTPVAVEDLRAAYRRTLEANETDEQPGTQPLAAPEHNEQRVSAASRVAANGATKQHAAPRRVDWVEVARLRAEASAALTDVLGEQPGISRIEQEEIGRTVISRLLDAADAAAIADRGLARPLVETRALADAVFDALFRLGRLQPLLDDDSVENVMITGHDRVVVEHADGSLTEADPVADSDEELLDFLGFVAARAENPRPFSPSHPALHLRLDDGSRLAAARDTARPSVVIRRHRVRQVTLADLVDWHTISPVMASFLAAAVKARRSIVVSGGQGDGKTTLVRALCAEIDPWEGDRIYRLTNVLCDADLFRRLRIRGQARGSDGLADYEAALALVTGTPYSGLRANGGIWLTDSRDDQHLLVAIVDVAHLAVTMALTASDIDAAEQAARIAIKAAPDEDRPQVDLAAVVAARGTGGESQRIGQAILNQHDDEGPLELDGRTIDLLLAHGWHAPTTRA